MANRETLSNIPPRDFLPRGGEKELHDALPDELELVAEELRKRHKLSLGARFDFKVTERYGTQQEGGHVTPTHEQSMEDKPLHFSGTLKDFFVYKRYVADLLITCRLCIKITVEQHHDEVPSVKTYYAPVEAVAAPPMPADD